MTTIITPDTDHTDGLIGRPVDHELEQTGTWVRTALGDLVNLAHAHRITWDKADDDKYVVVAVMPGDIELYLAWFTTERGCADQIRLILRRLSK